MGSLEITMTIKCGECITHDNYSFRRNQLEDILELSETINNAGFGKFVARQHHSDEITIKCLDCGHEDKIGI